MAQTQFDIQIVEVSFSCLSLLLTFGFFVVLVWIIISAIIGWLSVELSSNFVVETFFMLPPLRVDLFNTCVYIYVTRTSESDIQILITSLV